VAEHGKSYKRFLQFGRDSAGNWGSAATTVNHRAPILSFTRGVSREVIYSSAMDGTRFRQVAYQGAKRVRPTIQTELTYTGLLLFLDGLMGTDTFGANGGTTGAGPPYTHTFKMSGLPTGAGLFNSFCLEAGMGDIPAGKVERFTGAKIARATIAGSSHERLTLRLELIGKDHATNVTPTGALTSATQDCVLFDQMSSFNDGTGTTGDLISFELTIDNALSVRDYASELIDEPLASSHASATLRIVEEFQSRSAIDAHVALTQGAPALTFTSGSKVFTISMPKAYISDSPEPEGDRMTQSLLWTPIGDDGSPETYLTMTMTNTQSSISA
jgi:tail tube protein